MITPITSKEYEMELNNSMVIIPSKRNEPSSNPKRHWHMRLDYIYLNRINRLVKDRTFEHLVLNTMSVCESCIKGKITKIPFPPKGNRSDDL